MDMTLRQICEEIDVSRRAIQGYEKEGLVVVTGKNNRGHLFYDEAMQERIKTVRKYQKYGFTVKEIGEIIDAPADKLKAVLKLQRAKMEEDMENLQAEIESITELISQL